MKKGKQLFKNGGLDVVIIVGNMKRVQGALQVSEPQI